MDEYIEKDYHYSTRYTLIKNGERIEFNSEQDACEYLGVKKCSVASCFRKGYKCKGYEIERCGISTHGETNTRLHKIWESMIARCEYEKHPYYADYGGRGITVCDEWHSYIEFRDWAITHGYNNDLTIDRIKNEKGYDASNCRWATMREQQNNKRSNHIVYLGEIGHTISEWSEILGIGKTTIRMRIESGWSDEDALTVPVRKRTRGYRQSASCGAKMDVDVEQKEGAD